MTKKAMLFVVLVLLCSFLMSEVVDVEIIDNAEDTVGKVLVTKFRDVIRKSSAFKLYYGNNEPRFAVRFDTMDRYKGDNNMSGLSTIYNYTILVIDGSGARYFLHNQLGYAGRNTLDDVSYEIYSDLDGFVESVKAYIAP